MLFLVLTLFMAVSEPDLLPLNETVLLNPDVLPGDEFAELIEGFDLVFTVKSVTRRVSILGWASDRYDIEIGHELKGDLPEDTVFMYTFPCGMYSSQLSSLTEGEGLVVYASMTSSSGGMEGLRSSLGTLSVILQTLVD